MIALRQSMQSSVWNIMWLPAQYPFLPPNSNKQMKGDVVVAFVQCHWHPWQQQCQSILFSFSFHILTICSSVMSIPHPNSLDWGGNHNSNAIIFDSIDLMIERPIHCILLKENWLKMDSSCPKMMSGREFGGLHTLRFPPNSGQTQLHTLGNNCGHQHGIWALVLSPNLDTQIQSQTLRV